MKAIVNAHPCQLIGKLAPIPNFLGANHSGRSFIYFLSWWAAAPARLGYLQLDSALGQGLAQKAFNLRIDASQLGRGRAFDRSPQGGIDAERISLALGIGHRATLLVERACVDDRLSFTLTAQNHHQIGNHCRASLVVELDDILLGKRFERHLDHSDRPFD